MSVIVIEDWMIEEKGLNGLELLAFALIHGCTQKGDGCWYGGYDRLAERIGGKRRGTINALNHLEEIGAIERFDAVIDGKQRKGIRSVVEGAENALPGVQKMHPNGAENAPLYNSKEKESNNIIPDFSPDVEELYALYPTRCPKSGRGTDKGRESKKILVRLLKNHSQQEIAAAIRAYLDDCDKTNTFIKNFDSLLHRIERGDISGELFKQQHQEQQQEQPMYGSIEEWEAAKKANKK